MNLRCRAAKVFVRPACHGLVHLPVDPEQHALSLGTTGRGITIGSRSATSASHWEPSPTLPGLVRTVPRAVPPGRSTGHGQPALPPATRLVRSASLRRWAGPRTGPARCRRCARAIRCPRPGGHEGVR